MCVGLGFYLHSSFRSWAFHSVSSFSTLTWRSICIRRYFASFWWLPFIPIVDFSPSFRSGLPVLPDGTAPNAIYMWLWDTMGLGGNIITSARNGMLVQTSDMLLAGSTFCFGLAVCIRSVITGHTFRRFNGYWWFGLGQDSDELCKSNCGMSFLLTNCSFTRQYRVQFANIASS